MGTDIHAKIRYKQFSTDKEHYYIKNPPFFNKRDYDFFAIIGDVRNATGFAGCKRYDKRIEPITSNRKLPEGENNNDWEYGDHSFGYVTLKELKETELHKQTVQRVGYLDRAYYDTLEGSPTSWCGDISGAKIIKINYDEYEARNRQVELKNGEQLYIRYTWEDKPFEYKINKLIEFLSCYVGYGCTDEDVIYIFGFDS